LNAFGRLADFHWQAGYGAFSVSPAHLGALQEYIPNQEEHHRQESFQDEFRRLCRKYRRAVCVGLTVTRVPAALSAPRGKRRRR
jgi:hypothetical protein